MFFSWCGQTCYAYYTLALISCSTYQSRSVTSQLWHMYNLYDNKNLCATGMASRTLLFYSILGENHWGETITLNETCSFASLCQVFFCLHFFTGSLNNTPYHNWLHQWIFCAPFSPDAAVFHSLIRLQNDTCCVASERKQQKRSFNRGVKWVGEKRMSFIHDPSLIYFLLSKLRNCYDYIKV